MNIKAETRKPDPKTRQPDLRKPKKPQTPKIGRNPIRPDVPRVRVRFRIFRTRRVRVKPETRKIQPEKLFFFLKKKLVSPNLTYLSLSDERVKS